MNSKYEEFKSIPNYIGYSINRLGIIRKDSNNSIVSQALGKNGYYICFFT